MGEHLKHLADIEADVTRAKIPLVYTEHLYIFREHLDRMREKIRAKSALPAG